MIKDLLIHMQGSNNLTIKSSTEKFSNRNFIIRCLLFFYVLRLYFEFKERVQRIIKEKSDV